MYPMVDLYFQIKEPEKALYIANTIKEHTVDDLNYYARFNNEQKKSVKDPIQRGISILQGLYQIANHYHQEKFTKEIEPVLMNYYQEFGNL